MDQELFGLCKQVYEKTGWVNTYFYIHIESKEIESYVFGDLKKPLSDMYIPLYTSDYLLEKLPRRINKMPINIHEIDGKWLSRYGYNVDDLYGFEVISYASSDTPLKSLLKLTLSLYEAGEL